MLRQRSDAYSVESKSDDGGYRGRGRVRGMRDEDIEPKNDLNISFTNRKELSTEQWNGTYLYRTSSYYLCINDSPPVIPLFYPSSR